jgi:hypothetical protein
MVLSNQDQVAEFCLTHDLACNQFGRFQVYDEHGAVVTGSPAVKLVDPPFPTALGPERTLAVTVHTNGAEEHSEEVVMLKVMMAIYLETRDQHHWALQLLEHVQWRRQVVKGNIMVRITLVHAEAVQILKELGNLTICAGDTSITPSLHSASSTACASKASHLRTWCTTRAPCWTSSGPS